MSTLIREQANFLQDVCRLIAYAGELGFVVTGGELERKIELQELYTRMGRKDDNGSLHMRKCAIELNTYSMDSGSLSLVYDFASLKPLGDYWESLAPRNRWGGNWKSFKDLGHFERDIDRPVEGEGEHVALPPQITTEGAGEVLSASASHAIAKSSTSQPLLAPIRQGADNERAVVLLQSCLQQLGYVSSIDGRFGPGTAEAVKKFQASKSLVADGLVGEKTWTTLIGLVPELFQAISSKWLGDEDFANAASKMEVDEPAVRAIYAVESGGSGFLGVKAKILFEGHIFWRELKARQIEPKEFVAGNEDILYPSWTSQFYKGGMGEYARLERACGIDEVAALRSASWGLFQIMGMHAERLGFADVKEFVARMQSHEREHLNAFCEFVRVTNSGGKSLLEHLRRHDWASFAYGYNGAGYRKNRYDEKLAAAFMKAGGR